MSKALTIKNIPDRLHERLKEQAQAHHRSMNSEVLDILENVLGYKRVDPFERRRRLHEHIQARGSEELIQTGKRYGRA